MLFRGLFAIALFAVCCHSQVTCPTVANGTCDTCSDANTCTAVTCAANKFDTNGDATDGCEDGCESVTNGTCTACTSAVAARTCTMEKVASLGSIECNGDASYQAKLINGGTWSTHRGGQYHLDGQNLQQSFVTCLASENCNYITIATFDEGPVCASGNCWGSHALPECSSMVGVMNHNVYKKVCNSTSCTAVTCAANKFNTNGDVTDGCEDGCAVVTGGTCDACTSAVADGCTAVTCAANKFDTNADATDGCEAVDCSFHECTCTFFDIPHVSNVNYLFGADKKSRSHLVPKEKVEVKWECPNAYSAKGTPQVTSTRGGVKGDKYGYSWCGPFGADAGAVKNAEGWWIANGGATDECVENFCNWHVIPNSDHSAEGSLALFHNPITQGEVDKDNGNYATVTCDPGYWDLSFYNASSGVTSALTACYGASLNMVVNKNGGWHALNSAVPPLACVAKPCAAANVANSDKASGKLDLTGSTGDVVHIFCDGGYQIAGTINSVGTSVCGVDGNFSATTCEAVSASSGGSKGDQGEKGEKGDQGQKGEKGEKGDATIFETKVAEQDKKIAEQAKQIADLLLRFDGINAACITDGNRRLATSPCEVDAAFAIHVKHAIVIEGISLATFNSDPKIKAAFKTTVASLMNLKENKIYDVTATNDNDASNVKVDYKIKAANAKEAKEISTTVSTNIVPDDFITSFRSEIETRQITSIKSSDIKGAAMQEPEEIVQRNDVASADSASDSDSSPAASWISPMNVAFLFLLFCVFCGGAYIYRHKSKANQQATRNIKTVGQQKNIELTVGHNDIELQPNPMLPRIQKL